MIVALLGYGVVGKGVFELLKNNTSNIKVKYLFLRDESKANGLDTIVTTNFDQILQDDSVDTVIELIGGKTDAYTYVTKSLKAGKHVVTANKALISECFEELTNLAKLNHVTLLYEASVGGGIIVLDPLKAKSITNKVKRIEGIVNGSTNYILSKIFLDDYHIDNALEEARNLGYIETGSNDDMDGLDLLRKINILSMIAYHQYIQEEDIIRISLSDITEEFYSYVKSKGFQMKYIATSIRTDNQIQIHLEPVILGSDSVYSRIHYEENLVQVHYEPQEKESFQGIGAGRYPTASAVVYDLQQILEDNNDAISYVNHCDINNGLERYHFLIQKNNQFIKTKLLSFEELLQDNDILAVARIDESILEQL